MPGSSYQTRLVDRLLHELFVELPALAITGPRATGKTTTAARLARTVVRLDRPAEAAAFRADPDATLRALDEPVLLDEWQEVPAVLGAVKRAVDGDYRPGRFLLTGSVRADLEEATWPGTGRIVRVAMAGMTVRELQGGPGGTCFFDRVAGDEPLPLPAEVPDLRGYVGLALTGGFPEPALHMQRRARSAWLESYIDQVVTRDAPAVDPGRDPTRLRRYFESLALNTAGTVTEATIFEAAGVNRKTADAYERLLTSMFLTEALPSWTSNRLQRLSARPKRYIVDPALAASLLRVDELGVLREGALLGRVLDTFVASQLRAELPVARSRPRLYHLREEHGRHEVDLLAELGGGRVIAFEVKATASPARDDARHLMWLRDRLQDRFAGGIVLHTGPRPFDLDDRIRAVPICALWG
ncbi:MAG: ATP-binding protein [Acidimicrobiales bacterium]